MLSHDGQVGPTPPLRTGSLEAEDVVETPSRSYSVPLQPTQMDSRTTSTRARTSLPPDLRHPPGVTFRKSNIGWNDRHASFSNGRVLIIDYLRQADTAPSKNKIAAQELHSLKGLKTFYRDSRADQAALRIIHLQNAPWATEFLMQKYDISHKGSHNRDDFGSWLTYAEPELRAGKPFPKARVFTAQLQTRRALRCSGFTIDYLKHYPVARHIPQGSGSQLKMMEMNQYDEDGNPYHAVDIYAQRLSVYVQRSESEATGESEARNLDNSSTVLVFEKSVSDCIRDTLLTARDQLETRWRRIPFFISQERRATDELLALNGIEIIVGDVFRALAYNWEQFLVASEQHMSILEDKIYETPADETRAPELWYNSKNWLRTEKLLDNHLGVVNEIAMRLAGLRNDDAPQPEEWQDIHPQYEKLVKQIQTALIQPTANLNDLLYKSIGIRDSRLGLQLNQSLWRLSWITFIFLPLTFAVGFFGMNVDTFSDPVPSIKWWFTTAVCLMLLVLLVLYTFKHVLMRHHFTPYQRGVYEHQFYDLSTSRPDLWHRGGPRKNVRPKGLYNRIKWRLITLWMDPKKTIHQQTTDPDEGPSGSDLGTWARMKRGLVRRWLSDMRLQPESPESAAELAILQPVEENGGAIPNLIKISQTVATAGAAPSEATSAIHGPTVANMQNLHPGTLHTGQYAEESRPSSSGGGDISDCILEERDTDEVEPEDAPWKRRWRNDFEDTARDLAWDQ